MDRALKLKRQIVDRSFNKTVDSGLIPGLAKLKTIRIGIQSFSA